jgi:DNA-binding MarR family transcriptional regulator
MFEIDPLAALLLRVLHRSGGGASIGTLTATFHLPRSTTATAVARLERRGYAERSPLPLDRRASMVRLTDQGRTFASAVSDVIGSIEDQIQYIAGSDLLDEFDRLGSYLAAAALQPFGPAW